MSRIRWAPVVERAALIVAEYATWVTLRQLHYRLVSMPELGYLNTEYAYKRLSELTAEARREARFPPLADLTRSIVVPHGYQDVATALGETADLYRRDHTEGQAVVPVLLVEKATLLAQLREWFGHPLGIPIAALRGYSSESYDREIREYLESMRGSRRIAALYLGDFDPSGEDIERHARRCLDECFDSWERVAITRDVVDRFDLPESIGKESDSRARRFREKHGRLVQVEVEALDPNDLRSLLQVEVDRMWDYSEYKTVLRREQDEQHQLRVVAEGYR